MPVPLFLTIALIALALLRPSIADAESGWQWPVHGDVITSYSNDNSKPYAGGMHRGIDIAAPVGTNVEAARAGTVSYAGNLGSSGLTVAVRTDDGTYATSYLHLSAIAVSRGQHVDTGQRLGAVGTTGERSAQQPHLHFGVRLADRDNFYIDPLSLLPALPAAVVPATPAPVSAPVRARANAQPVAVAAPRPAAARRTAPRPAHPLRAPQARPQPIAVGRADPVRSGHPAAHPQRRRATLRQPAARPVPVRHPEVAPLPAATPAGAARPWGTILLIAGLGLLAASILPSLVRGIENASHLGMPDRRRRARPA